MQPHLIRARSATATLAATAAAAATRLTAAAARSRGRRSPRLGVVPARVPGGRARSGDGLPPRWLGLGALGRGGSRSWLGPAEGGDGWRAEVLAEEHEVVGLQRPERASALSRLCAASYSIVGATRGAVLSLVFLEGHHPSRASGIQDVAAVEMQVALLQVGSTSLPRERGEERQRV